MSELSSDSGPSWPESWMGPFLDRLAETGNVLKAARFAKKPRGTVYRMRVRDEAFARAWEEAKKAAVELVLEPEAFRRAVEGVTKKIYYQGQKIGTERQYSDTLLIFLLKAHAPEKYSERIRAESINANVDVTKLSNEQLDRLAAGEDLAVVLSTSNQS